MAHVVKFHEVFTVPLEREAILSGRLRALPYFGPADVGDWLRLKRADHADVIAEIVGRHHPGGLVGGGSCLLSLGLVGFDPLLEMTLPRPTMSMKNSRKLGWRAKVVPGELVRYVPQSRKSKGHHADIDMVKRHGMLAARPAMQGPPATYRDCEAPRSCVANFRNVLHPFGPDDMIHIDCRHLIDEDQLLVRAIKIGTLPKGSGKEKRGTKRDVHGLVELVADALQGVWWEDDRQIERAEQRRIR